MFVCERATGDRVSIWEWKKETQPHYYTPVEGSERGMEWFYYIFFVMLHESLKVRMKAKDEDVDKIAR